MARANANPRAPLRFTGILVIGTFVSLLLLVIVVVGATFAISTVERNALDLARRGERSTFVAGDIAHQLALLRAHVGSAVRRERADEATVARADEIRRRLHGEMAELPSLLHPEERRAWALVHPKIETLERELAAALARARAGDREGAIATLDRRSDDVRDIHEMLDQLGWDHERRFVAELDRARGTALRVRLIELFVGGALLVATLAIWLAVARAIRRQSTSLAEHAARLEGVNRDLDAFAGRVAHDLKNAVSSLPLIAAGLRRHAGEPARVEVAADHVQATAARAAMIVEGLLAFARASASAGNGDGEGKVASVAVAVHGVLEELEETATRVGVTIDVDVAPNVQVACAPAMLHIVLGNLCSNALKFLEGRQQRRLRIAARVDAGWCFVVVEDSGPGIPPEARERVFEPFYRVPGATASGSGIGLATVRRVIDAVGGSVAVDDVDGGGARFTVRLKLAAADADKDVAMAPRAPGVTP